MYNKFTPEGDIDHLRPVVSPGVSTDGHLAGQMDLVTQHD